MKNFFQCFFFLLLTFNGNAQKKVTLTIKHMLGTSPFAFGTASTNSLGQSFNFSRVEYYISQISIIHDGGVMTPVSNKYLLVNGSTNVNEELGTFSLTNVEGIKFYIGVESPTNNGDPALWSFSHPLALKTPSMHWGWSSGYRFIALEGKAGAVLATAYEMHGLGNPNYFSQTIMTTGVSSGTNVTINLDADYKEALYGIDVASGPVDHGVDATDLDALKNFRDRVFKAGTGLLSNKNIFNQEPDIHIYPNPGKGVFQIDLSNCPLDLNAAKLIDMTGREVLHLNLMNARNFEIKIETKGSYVLKLYSGDTIVGHRKIIVN